MLPLETVGRLAWLIPTFTAAAFGAIVALIVVGGSGRLAARIAVLAILASTVVALLVAGAALGAGGEALAHQPFVDTISWLPMGMEATGVADLRIGILVDPLSALAVSMVTLVCAAIFVFSTAYMEGEFEGYTDPRTGQVDAGVGNARYARFFAFIALFATGMLGFVLASNLLEAMVFWELMGLCSFLLIGFWYHKPAASAAAVKAFLTTRIGDVFLLAGILVLYGLLGNVDYTHLLSAESVARLAALGTVPGTGLPVAVVVALLLFAGAVGKSAQFPLHVWLPDAMEGPTPVSALIHAATMVSAGVFLVARMFPLFSALSPEPGHISGAMFVVAAVGAFTAIFAATIGVAQFDIKRVLAYSTVSQLGYMVMALGIGAYVAAVFHLITHAFFKGLLFLASGSVIHGVQHGMHHAAAHVGDRERDDAVRRPTGGADPGDAQDMRNMGNLRERMPFSFLTFLAGALALTGVPVFAGFWSKDEILADAFHKGIEGGILIAGVVWLLGTLAAFLTAFYMARQVMMVFYGPPQTEGARHAPESDMRMIGPLVFLALFALLLGFIGVPEGFWGLGPRLGNPLHHFAGTLTATGASLDVTPFNPWPMLVSVAMALGGWALGWWVYGRDAAAARAREPLTRLGWLWRIPHRKYYVDEIYHATVVRWTVWLGDVCGLTDRVVVDGAVNATGRVGAALARLSAVIDNTVVDGLVNLVAVVHAELSRGLRVVQSGRVQQYLLLVFLSVLLLVVVYII